MALFQFGFHEFHFRVYPQITCFSTGIFCLAIINQERFDLFELELYLGGFWKYFHKMQK